MWARGEKRSADRRGIRPALHRRRVLEQAALRKPYPAPSRVAKRAPETEVSRLQSPSKVSFRPHPGPVFPVPPAVLSLEQVLGNVDRLDGQHLWVLGILDVQEGDWVLMDESGSLTLEIDLDVA